MVIGLPRISETTLAISTHIIDYFSKKIKTFQTKIGYELRKESLKKKDGSFEFVHYSVKPIIEIK